MKTISSVRWGLLLIAPALFVSFSLIGCNKAEENASYAPAQGQPATAKATSATMPPTQSAEQTPAQPRVRSMEEMHRDKAGL